MQCLWSTFTMTITKEKHDSIEGRLLIKELYKKYSNICCINSMHIQQYPVYPPTGDVDVDNWQYEAVCSRLVDSSCRG